MSASVMQAQFAVEVPEGWEHVDIQVDAALLGADGPGAHMDEKD